MPKVLGVGSTALIADNLAADKLDVVLTVETDITRAEWINLSLII